MYHFECNLSVILSIISNPSKILQPFSPMFSRQMKILQRSCFPDFPPLPEGTEMGKMVNDAGII